MGRRIKLHVSTSRVGSKVEDYEELPDDWDEMTKEEQEKYLDDAAQNFLSNNAEYGAFVVED